MEKAKRLKLYSEKDYEEVIDFPVELVGKDGVVRRYSYADSVRIYERRIQSAHLRYSDRDIVSAEIDHCSRRLKQIHHSWQVRISACEREYVERRKSSNALELYTEGKHFLKQYVNEVMGVSHGQRPRDASLPSLVLIHEEPTHQVFYVSWHMLHPGTLVYVYRLDGLDKLGAKHPFERAIAMFRGAVQAPDTEKLILVGKQNNCGILLTSTRFEPIVRFRKNERSWLPAVDEGEFREYLPEPFAWLQEMLEAGEPAPLLEGIRRIQRGDFEGALSEIQAALVENPYIRDAYWAIAHLSETLDAWEQSAPYFAMALRYFPHEPRSHFYSGIAHYRMGDFDDALVCFEQALRLELKSPLAHGFLACIHGLEGRTGQAGTVVDEGEVLFPQDGSLRPLKRVFAEARRTRIYLWSCLTASFLLSVVIGYLSGLWVLGLILFLMSGGVLWVVGRHAATHRKRVLREWSAPHRHFFR